MTTDDPRLDPVRVWSAMLGSLFPLVALLVTIVIADDGVGLADVAAAVPLSLGFVALPSAMAIVAGRTATTRLAVTLVMTGVAVFAGVQVATIDDGQAGLAVLYIPMVAFPLAGVVWAGEVAAAALRGDHPGRTSPAGSRPGP